MFPLPAKARIPCPVCGIETGATICPNSQDQLREHQTYNNRFTSELYNPYWDNVLQGFRLGWDQGDLDTIYKDASSLVNTNVSLVSRPVPANSSMTEFYLSPNTLHGLTRDEVFALCLLGAYRSVEFPRTASAIDKGYKMFQGYKVPVGMQDRVFNVLGTLRNLYSLIIREPGPKLRPFRTGIMCLLFKWMLGPDMNNFLTYTDPAVDHTVMSRALSIAPVFKQYDAVKLVDIANKSDKDRRDAYVKAKDRYGPGPVISQLYYNELPTAGDLRLKQRVFDDLLWCMSEFDSVDVFGFPAFVFMHEDRLNRLFFLLAIASLRAAHDEATALDTVKRYSFLMSTLSPYIKLTPDIWSASDRPFHADLLVNREVHQGYMSALHRMPQWNMPDAEAEELFRRVCGYTKGIFASTINGKDIPADEVVSLQAGNTADGSTIEMLNFKKILSILGPYINDPSPLPFMAQPRYGILLCDGCGTPTEIGSQASELFITGSFESVNPNNGMPPKKEVQNLVLEYKCPKCKRHGCRQVQVGFDLKCPKCNAESSVVSYRFGETAVYYSTKCDICEQKLNHREDYDNAQLSITLSKITFTSPPRSGSHGEPMLVLVSSTGGARSLHFLEHPYNLLNSLPPQPTVEGQVPCPYESQESQTSLGAGSGPGINCCRGVPQEWDISRGAPAVNTVHDQPGQHRTRLVDELVFDDGTVRKRYECEDHKERVKALLFNMTADPTQNPKTYSRGDTAIDKIYMKNQLVGINGKNAVLHKNRFDTTRALMDVPLSLTAVPAIAGPGRDDIIESTRWPRSIEHPDTPVHEEPQDKFDPDKSVDYDRCLLKDDNKLALEVRHLYTFDVTAPAEPEPVKDCDELCKDWERLNLIRDTMALERMARTYKKRRVVKKIRQWQLGHSPAHIVVSKSMPFIPTVTPKERIKVEYSRERELLFTGVVSVLVDISSSMSSGASGAKGDAKFICDYILTRDECHKCGGHGYSWSDADGCYKSLRRIDVARRLLVSIINEAKQREDKVAIYAYNTSCRGVSSPSRDYKELTDMALNSPKLNTIGGTDLPIAVRYMTTDIESGEIPDMLVTIIITDGDVGLGSLPGALLPILKNYGPVYIYQITLGTSVSEDALKSKLRGLGWDPDKGDHPITWEFVDLSDGGKELFRKAAKETKKHLKR